ncbi:RNA 3'-terminal phosphate cyclase isoform X2 [Amyelois transitella]|uniref:RNA 3'-terminal phosphate cyclase isoform X2 n=1 Tax=Amyelois transitella TaxID=680683 RepID=UPI00298F4458|nr:RNA 3'-terminal phosphate cyclase isoform X2 [Amyelois transitella]
MIFESLFVNLCCRKLCNFRNALRKVVNMVEIIDVDGSVLEGGGQILRIAVSLSAILRQPVRVSNIRAGRKKPGLAAQHLSGIQLVGEMCKAKLKGVSIGSTQIEIWPGKILGGHYMADTKTAGSTSLLLQVALPVALMADGPVTLDLKGGTNADMAPQIDYTDLVFKPLLHKFGGDLFITVHRRGYFPRGGGHVTIQINPVKQLRSVNLTEAGSLVNVRGSCFVAGTLPVKIAYQMCDGAKKHLCDECSELDIRCYKEPSGIAPDNCSGIILSCCLSSGCVIGGDALCKRGCDSFDTGRKLADELVDQLRKQVKFNVQDCGDHAFIECNGIGHTNKNLPI